MVYLRKLMSEVFFLKYFIIMFNGKFFNEKFLLTRKYYDSAHAINCTRKLTCMGACTGTCNRTLLREQYDVPFIDGCLIETKITAYSEKSD